MSKPKAALLEIYDSHDVNLYSQLLFLKEGGYETTLIVSEAHRKQVESYGLEQETLFCRVTDKKGLALWKELWRLRGLILERNIPTVIFNTAHSNPVRNFCLLPFPSDIQFFGTLHGVNKLQGSLTQKIISRRIPNYYLLMDYMLEKAMKVPHDGLRFSVFYPIFHPKFPEATLPEKKDDHIWIAIPGAVEYKRRDYISLVEALARVEIRPNLRFFLLGNGYHSHGNGADLKQRIEALGLSEHFIFFDGFVPDEVMHTCLRRCDAVMPLIHPINADMEKYLENQISGSFHRAFGYRKPLLLHDYYRRYQDFRETGIFYNLENLSDFLSRMPAELAAFTDERYDNAKWTLDYQATNYCNFLKSPSA